MSKNIVQYDDKGRLHGLQVEYHDNGQLWMETNYKHGVRHGEWIEFFEDGKLWEHCTFRNGEEVGYSYSYIKDYYYYGTDEEFKRFYIQ